MSALCIQVQLGRLPAIDIDQIRMGAELLASDKSIVNRFTVIDGEDEGRYTNILFETSDLEKLWGQIRDKLYANTTFGPGLFKASIAMCEGKDGWNDYILLYHFDPSVKIDRPWLGG